MSGINLPVYAPFTPQWSSSYRSRLKHKEATLFLDGHELNAGVGVSVKVSWRERQGTLIPVVELI
jgi:hypothetical protein